MVSLALSGSYVVDYREPPTDTRSTYQNRFLRSCFLVCAGDPLPDMVPGIFPTYPKPLFPQNNTDLALVVQCLCPP